MNNEQNADLLPSASLVQNGLLAEAKFRPILFSTDMVRAILEGRKTQTRRIIKEIPAETKLIWFDNAEWVVENDEGRCWKGQLKQRYKVGDILWVRETFYEPLFEKLNGKYYYKADLEKQGWDFKWKPSLFMPKQACRLFLKISNVEVQRLQDISSDECIAEGYDIRISRDIGSIPWFKKLWIKINGELSWNQNPFVWVVSFEITERPQGFC